MLDDAGTIAEGAKLDCDVVLVGAGPAGLTLADELASTGLDILVLDAGGLRPMRPMEAGDQDSAFSVYSLSRTRARGFGGTSALFLRSGWRARPLDPIDLEPRVGRADSGWPFPIGELQSYYERAIRALDLSELGFGAAAWMAREDTPPLHFADSSIQTSVFQFAPADGFLDRAAKAAAWSSVRVLLGAHVTGIETLGPEQRVDHLRVRAPHGGTFRVQARAYVLASGGIDNARLLLSAGKAGLGNQRDLVGRYFMEHLHVNTGVFWPAKAADAERLGFYSQHPSPAGGSIQGVLRLSDEAQRTESLLNVLLRMHAVPGPGATAGGRSTDEIVRRLRQKRWPEQLGGHLWNCARDWRSLGARVAHKVAGRKAPIRAAVLAIEAEQAPNPESRLVLSDRTDAFGMRLPHLRWRSSEADIRSIRRAQEVLHEALQRAQLGHLENLFGDERPPARIGGGAHHMGTTRMHRDPAQGVVDPQSKVHGIDDLYVAGSSVFPTSGGSNPTLTIVALAIRLADHLASSLLASSHGSART